MPRGVPVPCETPATSVPGETGMSARIRAPRLGRGHVWALPQVCPGRPQNA